MKLDPTMLRYLSKDDFRTLTAVEQGMKNHEIVPTPLIVNIAKLKHGGAKKSIGVLHKNKLVWHSGQQYDGYRLTSLGYDYLALKAFTQREMIIGVGRQIGVGKESDIYIVYDNNDKEIALKIHRLGRTSFRTIKNNRDYLQNRKSASWIYMSRLAALKEYAFMKALKEHNFPVPTPIDWSRHCVLMSLVDGFPLNQVREMKNPAKVYGDLMNLIIKLAQYGLIHCDFNEFNLLINEREEITLIDFPQMVSTSHPNAEMYFNRDVECIKAFFFKRLGFEAATWPVFSVDTEKKYSLDVAIAASGFSKEDQMEFDKLHAQLEQSKLERHDDDEDDDEDSEDEDSEEEENEETNENEKESEKKVSLLDSKEAKKQQEPEQEKKELTESIKTLQIEEKQEAQEEESESSEDEQEDYIKKRVKQGLQKKNRQSVKRNSNKLRGRERKEKDTRDAIRNY